MPADISPYSLIRPPAPLPGPMENYGTMLQLQGLIGNQATNTLQREHLQRSLDQDKALQAYVANATPEQMNANDFYQKAIGAGAAPDEVLKMQASALQNKKTTAELSRIEMETLAAKAKDARDTLAGVNDQASYDAWRQYGTGKGYQVAAQAPATFDPNWQRQHLMTADQMIERLSPKLAMTDTGGVVQPTNPYTGQAAGALIKKTMTPGEIASNAIARAHLNVTASTADPFGILGIKDIAARAGASAGAGAPGTSGVGNGAPANAPNALPGASGAAGQVTIAPPTIAGKDAAPIQPGNWQSLMGSDVHGDDFLKALPPGIAPQIKAYAEGRKAFPAGFAEKSPYFQALMQMVGQYDPTFDAVNYNKRNRTAIMFSSGKQGDAMRAAGQAIQHAGSLAQTIEDLNNSNAYGANLVTPAINLFQRKILNDTHQGTFQMNAQALSSELRKVYAGSSGGSLTELRAWEDSLPLNESKQQQQAYLKRGIELLSGAIDNLNAQYREGMGPKANILNDSTLIAPKPKAVLQRILGGEDPIDVLRAGGASATRGATVPAGSVPIRIQGDDGYNALPKGAHYVGPDGVERVK